MSFAVQSPLRRRRVQTRAVEVDTSYITVYAEIVAAQQQPGSKVPPYAHLSPVFRQNWAQFCERAGIDRGKLCQRIARERQFALAS